MPDDETITETEQEEETSEQEETTTVAQIERKWLAHYIDSTFGGTTASYVRIGKDLEEYNIEMNPDEETKKNILGESSTRVKGYEPQGSVDTFYAESGDALYTKLETIVNTRATGTALHTTVIDVLVNSEGTVQWAYKEDAIVIPQSIGGDTSGVQIPFEIKYCGNRVSGTFNTSTNAFTAST